MPNANMAKHIMLKAAKTRHVALSSHDRKTGPIDYLFASSSALQDGEQTACDLPKIFLETIWDRARCLPHKKQDMVAAPKDVAAVKGEPDTLDL
ncbi:MAG: hypothetical protein IPN53_25115 [Comamonadaceae bacterium]|nr:hypothetical protein [Comamonadaceae bacterium]